MAFTVEAVYENGVLKPVGALPLKEREKVRVTVELARPPIWERIFGTDRRRSPRRAGEAADRRRFPARPLPVRNAGTDYRSMVALRAMGVTVVHAELSNIADAEPRSLSSSAFFGGIDIRADRRQTG